MKNFAETKSSGKHHWKLATRIGNETSFGHTCHIRNFFLTSLANDHAEEYQPSIIFVWTSLYIAMTLCQYFWVWPSKSMSKDVMIILFAIIWLSNVDGHSNELICWIPCHWFACHWIKMSIVFWLVLIRAPLNSNNSGGVFISNTPSNELCKFSS